VLTLHGVVFDIFVRGRWPVEPRGRALDAVGAARFDPLNRSAHTFISSRICSLSSSRQPLLLVESMESALARCLRAFENRQKPASSGA
jgi:hypothetical protein